MKFWSNLCLIYKLFCIWSYLCLFSFLQGILRETPKIKSILDRKTTRSSIKQWNSNIWTEIWTFKHNWDHCNGFGVVVEELRHGLVFYVAVNPGLSAHHPVHLLLASPRFAMQSAMRTGLQSCSFRKEHWATFCWASQPVVWQALSLTALNNTYAPKALRIEPNRMLSLDVTHTKTAQTSPQKTQSCHVGCIDSIQFITLLHSMKYFSASMTLWEYCAYEELRGSNLISNDICKRVSNFLPWEHNLCLKEIASSVTIWCNTGDGLKQLHLE